MAGYIRTKKNITHIFYPKNYLVIHPNYVYLWGAFYQPFYKSGSWLLVRINSDRNGIKTLGSGGSSPMYTEHGQKNPTQILSSFSVGSKWAWTKIIEFWFGFGGKISFPKLVLINIIVDNFMYQINFTFQ